MKNDRYGVKTGVRFAYQSYLKALSENDDSMLRSTCEQNLYWASKDSIDSLRDFDDEFDYELRVLNEEDHSKIKVKVLHFRETYGAFIERHKNQEMGL